MARPPDSVGGFLDADDDLRVLWLAMRVAEHAPLAQSALLPERGHAGASVARLPGLAAGDLAAGRARLYAPALRVPWARALKSQIAKRLRVAVESVPAAPAGAGSPGVGNLRAREAVDVLSAKPCYGARWDELVADFYPRLGEAHLAYNRIVLSAVAERDGTDALERIATLVRLAYANQLLAALDKKIGRLEAEAEAARADPASPPAAPSPPLAPVKAADAEPLAALHALRGAAPTRRRGAGRVFVAQVTPVREAAGRKARDYIVGGMLVPAQLLNAVEHELIRDYRIYFQGGEGRQQRYTMPVAGSLASLANTGTALLELPPVPNVITPHLAQLPPPALPPPLERSVVADPPRIGKPPGARPLFHERGAPLSPRQLGEHGSVDAYLRERFGVRWSSVCSAAIRCARRQAREAKLQDLAAALALAEEARGTGRELRQTLVDRAVAHDLADAGLAGMCAIALARREEPEKLAALRAQIPGSVWRTVDRARHRIEALTSGDSTDADLLTGG